MIQQNRNIVAFVYVIAHTAKLPKTKHRRKRRGIYPKGLKISRRITKALDYLGKDFVEVKNQKPLAFNHNHRDESFGESQGFWRRNELTLHDNKWRGSRYN